MGAQLPGVHLHPLVADRLVGGLDGLDVAGERHLGVDDHLTPVGEGHDQVGPHAGALVVDRRGLLDEVAVLEQAGDLDHPPQLHLAPAAAYVRRAQRRDQRRRLVLELRRRLADRAHLLAQLAVRGGAVALHAGEQPVQVVERLVHRFEAGALRGACGPSSVTTPSVAAVARSAPRRRPVSREAASMARRGAGGVRHFPPGNLRLCPRRVAGVEVLHRESRRRALIHAATGACSASWSSSQRLTGVPQRKPRPPPEPSTRWQGTNRAAALRAHAFAEARDGGGPAAAGREGGVAVGVPGRDGAQDLPRLGQEGARTLVHPDVVDRGDVTGEELLHHVEHRQVVRSSSPRRRSR